MNLLLDTHALLWWLADSSELPEKAKALIASTDNEVYVSAASGWEIAIKRALGKLKAPAKLSALIEEEGLQHLPITFLHAEKAGALPAIHRDPFDRMLVAQAQVEDLTILTRDTEIAKYDVPTAWE